MASRLVGRLRTCAGASTPPTESGVEATTSGAAGWAVGTEVGYGLITARSLKSRPVAVDGTSMRRLCFAALLPALALVLTGLVVPPSASPAAAATLAAPTSAHPYSDPVWFPLR